jgi:hypothetical protein
VPYAYGNGGDWPERLRAEPIQLPELSEHPTERELARAYGSVVVAWAHQWPIVVEALQWLYGAAMGARGMSEETLRRLDRIERHIGQPLPPMRDGGVPPMREEATSSHDLAKAVGRDVAQRYEAERVNPSTPPPSATTVAAMVEERVQIELLRIRAANLEKARAASDKLVEERRKDRRKILIAVIVSALSIAAAVVDHILRFKP